MKNFSFYSVYFFLIYNFNSVIFLLKKRKIYNLKCNKYTYNKIANGYTMLQNVKYGQIINEKKENF